MTGASGIDNWDKGKKGTGVTSLGGHLVLNDIYINDNSSNHLYSGNGKSRAWVSQHH